MLMESSCGAVRSATYQGEMTPFSSVGGVSLTSARATQSSGLQELVERRSRFGHLEHVPDHVARRRACPRVPASPKVYPSRTRGRIEISPVQATQHAHLQGCRASPLTDSNRRPPPYHRGFAPLLCDRNSAW
jgi:hypothetical protein